MTLVSTAFKRLFVRNLKWTADEQGDTLANVLKAAAQAKLKATENGKVLVSTSGNGRTATWEVPDDFSPNAAAELISEILDRYDEARVKLVSDGTASPTDTQIYNELMDKLQAVRSYSGDFSGIRFPCELEVCE